MRDEGPAICNRGRNKTDCKGISKGIKSDCKSLDPWGPVVFNRGRVTKEKFKKAIANRLTLGVPWFLTAEGLQEKSLRKRMQFA